MNSDQNYRFESFESVQFLYIVSYNYEISKERIKENKIILDKTVS